MRCKDRVSTRIVEHRVKTVKLWLKHDHKDLFVKVFKQQGLKHKEKGYFGITSELAWTAG